LRIVLENTLHFFAYDTIAVLRATYTLYSLVIGKPQLRLAQRDYKKPNCLLEKRMFDFTARKYHYKVVLSVLPFGRKFGRKI